MTRLTRKAEQGGNLLECLGCGKMLMRGRFRNKNKFRKWEKTEDRRKYLDYISDKATHCKTCEKPDVAARNQKRRALEARALGSHNRQDIEDLMFVQQGRCKACGCSLIVHGYHVDHRIPLSKGGSNGRENLQLLCPPCNLRKADKLEIGVRTGVQECFASNPGRVQLSSAPPTTEVTLHVAASPHDNEVTYAIDARTTQA